MPLTEDEQKRIERVESGLKDLLASIDQYDDFPRQAAAMGKLDTRGERPDYSTFTDRELRDVYERGKLNPDINALPDNDPDSIISLAESGKSSTSLSRQELETTVDKWLASRGYAIPSQDLAAARINHLTSVDRSTGGQIQNLQFDYWNVQDSVKKRGESYKNDGISALLKAAKEQSAVKIATAEKDLSAIASQGVRGSLEMAAKNNASPAEVAELIEKGRHLIATGEIDLRGTIMTGLDLSQSDLSRVKIDITTLAQASGLEQVQGADPELKAAAIARHPEAVKIARVQEKVRASAAGQAAGKEAPRGVPRAGKIAQQGDLSGLSANEMKGAMQASETYRINAAQGKVLGEGGETMGYAKLQVGQRTEMLAAEVADASQALMDAGLSKFQIGDLGDSYRSIAASEGRLSQLKDPAEIAALEKLITGPRQSLEQKIQKAIASVPEDQRSSLPKALERYKEATIPFNKSETVDGLTRGAANPLFKLETEYGQGSNNSKEKEIDATFLARSVASFETDRLLGTNVCSEEKFGVDEQGRLIGVSVAVDGAQVSRITPIEVDGKSDLTSRFLRTDYASHEVQKGLYNLEALDYITGQIDRHPGNIVIDPASASVKGIDNDLAFPEDDRDNVLERGTKAVANLPMFMHKDTAEKIAAVTPDQLRETLSKVEFPDKPGRSVLSHDEIEGAVARLKKTQEHIKKLESEGKIVTTFDETHYKQAVKAQLDGLKNYAPNRGKLASDEEVTADKIGRMDIGCPRTSYVGAIELARLEVQAEAQKLGLARPLDSPANEAPRNAEYSAAKAVQVALQKGMSPAKAREEGMLGVQKRYDDLVQKVQEQGAQISNLQQQLQQTPPTQVAERRTLNLELQDALKQQDNNLRSLEQCQKEKTAVATTLAADSAQSLEQRQQKLEAKLDQLQDKPGFMNKMKSLRHGGVNGEIKHVSREIDAIKQERQAVLQAAGGKIGADDHREKAQIGNLKKSAETARLQSSEHAPNLNGSGKPSTAEALGLKKAEQVKAPVTEARQNLEEGQPIGKNTAEAAGLKKVGQKSSANGDLQTIAKRQAPGKVKDMVAAIESKNAPKPVGGPKV